VLSKDVLDENFSEIQICRLKNQTVTYTALLHTVGVFRFRTMLKRLRFYCLFDNAFDLKHLWCKKKIENFIC